MILANFVKNSKEVDKMKKIFFSFLMVVFLIAITTSIIYISLQKVDKKDYEICMDATNMLKQLDSQDPEEILQTIAKAKEAEKVEEGIYSNLEDYEINCAEAFQNALVLGDSFAEGLVGYGVLYSNNVVGIRSRGIKTMDEDLEKAIIMQPQALFLQYGANDLLNFGSNVDGFINAYETQIDLIREKLPNTELYINCVLPVSQEVMQNSPNFQYYALYNEKLEALCEEKDCTFIDNIPILENSDAPFSPDGIHPNVFFYRKWAIHMIRVAKF